MLRLTLSTLALVAGLLTTGAPAMAQAIDTAAIETATGLKGSYNQAENVFKVSKPRDDVKINVDRWTMPPFMGLTSWAAFTPNITPMNSGPRSCSGLSRADSGSSNGGTACLTWVR